MVSTMSSDMMFLSIIGVIKPSFILAVVLECLRQLQPVNGHPVDNVLLDGLPAQRLQGRDWSIRKRKDKETVD